jgi:nucleotide-binding universal stress UspA family protein
MQIKRILVPTDFSRPSLKAVDYAIDLARQHQAEVVFVHVIEPMSYAVPRYLPEPTALLEEQRKEAQDALERLVERVAKGYPRCRSEVHLGVVYERIAELARTLKADLIVIATHGRTGLAHLLIGSVAERVVRMAPCPVLTVRGAMLPARLARRGRVGAAGRKRK